MLVSKNKVLSELQMLRLKVGMKMSAFFLLLWISPK